MFFLYFNFLITVLNALNVADYPSIKKIPPINKNWSSVIDNTVVPSEIIKTCPVSTNWAVTYDDGPGVLTDNVLKDLASVNIKGTFFVVGSQVLQYPNTLLAAYNAGHQIAIHTWSHANLTNITDDEIISEIVWTAKIIKDVIGVTPTMIRPPYGEVNDRVQKIITNLGLKTILWNRDPTDWCFSKLPPVAPCALTDTPSKIVDYFKTWISEPLVGSISLEHDLFNNSAQNILPSVNVLLTSKYNITNVVGCIGGNAYDETFWNRIGNVPILQNPNNTNINGNGGNNNSSSSNKKNSGTSLRQIMLMSKLLLIVYLL